MIGLNSRVFVLLSFWRVLDSAPDLVEWQEVLADSIRGSWRGLPGPTSDLSRREASQGHADQGDTGGKGQGPSVSVQDDWAHHQCNMPTTSPAPTCKMSVSRRRMHERTHQHTHLLDLYRCFCWVVVCASHFTKSSLWVILWPLCTQLIHIVMHTNTADDGEMKSNPCRFNFWRAVVAKSRSQHQDCFCIAHYNRKSPKWPHNFYCVHLQSKGQSVSFALSCKRVFRGHTDPIPYPLQ